MYVQGKKQVLQNYPVRSFQSCVDPKLIFGMGQNTMADSLEIIWPDLTRQVVYNLSADKEIVLEQKNADKKFTPPAENKKIFKDVTASVLASPAVHNENVYVDFNSERLIPYMLSSQGPKLSSGDVNNDGLEDFYMGGAVNEPGRLFIQSASGFAISKQEVFEVDKEKEDAGFSIF